MTCGRTWTTATGETMAMHDMTDQHVLNAYRRLEEVLEENPDSADVPYPNMHSDEAQYHAEQDYEQYLEWREEVQADHLRLEAEIERRGIDPDNPAASRPPLRPATIGRRKP